MARNVLEYVGGEFVGIMCPVSICMFLVVLLVFCLSSPSNIFYPVLAAADFVYMEKSSDSTTQKLEGTLLNAAVFVSLMAVATYLVFLLYYYNFANFLKNYMRFSVFTVLGFMGGSIFLSIIQHFQIPIDSITCAVLLFNFTVVGVLSVFSRGIPIFMRQVYMVLIGCFVAFYFTKMPEWTTWGMLVALAFYDFVAVLAPGGPLKILVELASHRDDDLPGLIYESRPVEGRGYMAVFEGRPNELQTIDSSNRERSLLVAGSPNHSLSVISESSERSTVVDMGTWQSEIVEERSPLVERSGVDIRTRDDDSVLPGIQLGLGDFIFYSVLVGRAAMHDLMTVCACYIAIISGLGCTITLSSVWSRALPALPISITLGIMVYFSTRLLVEPFAVGTSTNLLMF